MKTRKILMMCVLALVCVFSAVGLVGCSGQPGVSKEFEDSLLAKLDDLHISEPEWEVFRSNNAVSGFTVNIKHGANLETVTTFTVEREVGAHGDYVLRCRENFDGSLSVQIVRDISTSDEYVVSFAKFPAPYLVE